MTKLCSSNVWSQLWSAFRLVVPMTILIAFAIAYCLKPEVLASSCAAVEHGKGQLGHAAADHER